MIRNIKEGNANLQIYTGEKVSKELPVFYNPAMKINRDITIGLLSVISKKNMRIADVLSASGVRGIRLLTELTREKIETLFLNDLNKEAISLIKKNIKLNKLSKDIKGKKIQITQKDANLFLLDEKGFDYIDIDPFGCPNAFLDSAVKRLSRDGILAVTATDTSALAGTFPFVCRRKYWANPIHNELMHEIAVRILIRKVQLVAAQYEKAMTPIYSYASQHYVRVFFQSKKGKKEVDILFKQHHFFLYCNNCMNQLISDKNTVFCCKNNMISAGPIYSGNIFNINISRQIAYFVQNNGFMKTDNQLLKLVNAIADESKIKSVGFYDIHVLVEKYKLKNIPSFKLVFSSLEKMKIPAERTHFNEYAIKTECNIKELVEIIKQLN